MNVLEKILEEIEEATFQEDAPVYVGDMEVDGYVRASRVEEIIRSHMNDVTDINVGSKSDWIPCSERFPEDGEEMVLIQVNGKPTENIRFENAFEFAYYQTGEGWMLENYPEWKKPEVVAWQPLPEPYKGEEAAGE